MGSKRCRLYDENLVHNIMVSTGLSVVEYLRENANADSDEVCDFIEANAEKIVNDTIRHLKNMENIEEKEPGGAAAGTSDDTKDGSDSDQWPLTDEEE